MLLVAGEGLSVRSMANITPRVNYPCDGASQRMAKLSGNPPQPYKLYWYGMSGLDALVETDTAGSGSCFLKLNNAPEPLWATRAAGGTATEYIFSLAVPETDDMLSEAMLGTDLTSDNAAGHSFFGGKRIAQREAGGAVFYYFADHLGSSRVVTDATGTILDDSDYYPFGGERAVASGSGNTYKFTGKERDPESSLDYFVARYYSSGYGRFLSPDEFTGGPVDAFSSSDPLPPGALPYADITNPQSLNKYTYTFNNPLKYTDPDGHLVETLWDAANVVLGVNSFVDNVKAGNVGAAVLDAVGVVADVAAAVAPGVPGGAGAAIKAARAADKVDDALDAVRAADNVADATKAASKVDEAVDTGKAASAAASRPGQDFTPAGKRQVDARDGNQRQDCGRNVQWIQNKRGQPTPADQRQRHHIRPKSEGGGGTPENGITLCPGCHKERHRKLRNEKEASQLCLPL